MDEVKLVLETILVFIDGLGQIVGSWIPCLEHILIEFTKLDAANFHIRFGQGSVGGE